MNRPQTYEQLTGRFVRWAQAEENIRAAIVIGSRARVDDHPADEWSDLDIIILACDPQPYWATAGWLAHVGEVWLTFVEPAPDGAGFERRALFEGGLDVDFAPDPVARFECMLEQGLPPDLADMFRRGARFLVDKDGLAERLARVPLAPPPPAPPAETEFLNLVNDFWYHTVWTGKHLRRGELWWAKSCCDGYLKNLLRQMMEWRARHQGGTGRYLDARAVPGTMGRRTRGAGAAGNLCPLRRAGCAAGAAGHHGAVPLAGARDRTGVGLHSPLLRRSARDQMRAGAIAR